MKSAGRGLVGLMLPMVCCALPDIQRESPDARDAAVATDSGASDAMSGEDAGIWIDDSESFRALLPKEHVFAAWLMPDSSEYAKAKPSYTVSGPIIIDNVTKLRWQAKMPTIYPGCTTQYELVGRLRGVGSGCNWHEAQAYCASAELAAELGEGHWRVPTKIELESLIDVSRIHPVDLLFDDFPIESLWTSSPYPVPSPEGKARSWQVDLMEGASGGRDRVRGSRVRCVSSPNDSGGDAQAFEIRDELVLDSITQLQWERFPDRATRNWQDAIAYCDELELDGGGWHLPSLKELVTLVDATRHDPAIEPQAFPGRQDGTFWSSSEYLNQRDSVYVVEFGKGGIGITSSYYEPHAVRCTR